ncbi:MAG: iron ABC transporter permease [Alphaproteobacteria bacterium]|nr:MAG: iron ABC transporter permease [Alphaproteobacteria bacterium]
MNRFVALWLAVGLIGFFVLPWYTTDDAFWSFTWVFDGYPLDSDYAPAVIQIFAHGKIWLAPVIVFFAAILPMLRGIPSDRRFAATLTFAGAGGLAYLLLQGFTIGIAGWEYASLEALFGPVERQFGMGVGAVLVAAAFLFLLTQSFAARGCVGGDLFVAGSIGLIIALIAAFVFFPVSRILISAFQDNDGVYAFSLFAEKISHSKIWGLRCLSENVSCGVAWNSLALAVSVGFGSTLLGLAFALVTTRARLKMGKAFRVLTVLPIITPPFVIGLAMILLFGRAGVVTQFVSSAFDIPPTRWIYGFTGIWLAQMLAFTPIAFLVLIGVVEGISPSMEEAAQTLRADAWTTFSTVSFPLMRPGLANAFLLGFIESMADFGNPFVLGGNYGVLSTEIFFAIVGAQNDQGGAAVLAIVLLAFTLTAFYAQRRWVGKKSYVTVTGKGDAGLHAMLPKRLTWLIYAVVIPWTFMMLVIYGMVMFGGFVKTWGRDHSLTLRHYADAFSVATGEYGAGFWPDPGFWSGTAWNSFWTTISISAIAAPLTAGLGLLTAYLLVRQRFAGRAAFEFGTMLSFAIPGTVIGISYILAFNIPPIELTGTGIILIICFMFRNMPVGLRAGVAAMSQLDKNLDEASLTLGANSFTTLRYVILPLLRPAIAAALVFSFVRAITSVSAVIFLVSANYHMATAYIIGRVENGDYGLAIAYSSVLILVMLVAVTLVQLIIGRRKLGRREAATGANANGKPAGAGQAGAAA